MLFLCKLPEGFRPIANEPDKTLLRVYFNPETESHLVAESVIFTLLSERQLGPQLYGIFNGGRLEEYIVVSLLFAKKFALCRCIFNFPAVNHLLLRHYFSSLYFSVSPFAMP